MSFGDFKGIWKVIDDNMGGETMGHWIAIGGTAEAVKILCIHDPFNHTYDTFTYQPGPPERLVGPGNDPPVISLPPDKPNTLTYVYPFITPGSWTANDNLG